MSLKERALHFLSNAKLRAKDAAPGAMIIGGTLGLVAAGVMACVETSKELDQVLEQHKEKIKAIKEVREDARNGEEVTLPDGSEYTEQTYKKHITFAYIQTGGKLIKVYGPSIVLALLSILSILGGHKILKARHLAAVAETYAISETFKNYRERVADKIGEEAEKALFVDGERQLLTEESVDPETGELKSKTEDRLVARKPKKDANVYSYIFDECNAPNTWNRHPGYNYTFLVQMQNNANEYLKLHGCITLWEVLKQIGMTNIPAETMSLGWMLDNPTGYGDGYIDFGICSLGDYDDVGCFKGGLPDYMLNFNCDGDIQAAMTLAREQKKAAKKTSRKPKAVFKG